MSACSAPLERGLTFREEWLQRVPTILETASEFQRDILTDLVVTEVEHERAQQMYVGCIQDAGVEVLVLDRDEFGNIRNLELRGPTPPGPADVMARCQNEYYTYVGDAWRVALHPADTEQAQLRRIAECLVRSGYNVPTRPTDFGELLSAAEAISSSAKARLVSCNEQEQYD